MVAGEKAKPEFCPKLNLNFSPGLTGHIFSLFLSTHEDKIFTYSMENLRVN